MQGNLYTVLNEYGHASSWDSHWNPSFIASELRRCKFFGIGIWPDSSFTSLGHALTAWGDGGIDGSPLDYLWVTDSDRDSDAGLNLENYFWTYDPNAAQGKGLYYLSYYPGAGYLGYMVTLSPVPESASVLLLVTGLAILWLGSNKARRRRE